MLSWAAGSLERLSQTIAPVASDPISRFVYACQQNDEEAATQLVPQLGGAGVIVNATKGHVAMHVACLNSMMNLTRLLLTQPGASIEVCDADGNTGLHCAAMSNKPQHALELVAMLVTDSMTQANVTAKNSKGQTPYDVAKISSVRQYLLPLQLQKETREALENGGQGLPPGIDLGGLKIQNSTTLAPPPMMNMGGGGGGMGMGTTGGGSYPPLPPQLGGGGGGGGGGYATESSMIPRAPSSSDGIMDQQQQQQQQYQTTPPPPLPPAPVSNGHGGRVSSAPASSSSSGYSLSGSSSAAIYKPPPGSARGRSFVQPDGFHSSSSDKRLQEKYGHHTTSSGNLAAVPPPPPPSSGNHNSGNLPIGAGGSGHISAPPSFGGGVANNPYAGGASHLTARRTSRYVSYDPITGQATPPPSSSTSAPPSRAGSFSSSYLPQQPPAAVANFNVFTPPAGAGGQQQPLGGAAGTMAAPAPASAGFSTSATPSQYPQQTQYQQQQQQAYQQQQQQAYQQQQQQQGYQYHQQYQPAASPADATAAAASSSLSAGAEQHLMQPPPHLGGGGVGGSFGGGISPLANSAAAMFGSPSPTAAAAAASAATTSSPMGTSGQPFQQQQPQSPSHLFSMPTETTTSSPLAAASALFGAPSPAAGAGAAAVVQQQHEPAPTANAAFGTPQREYQQATFGAPPQAADQQPLMNTFSTSQPTQEQQPQQHQNPFVVAAAPRSNDGMMGFSSTVSTGSITKAPSSGGVAPSSGGMPLDFGGRASSIRSAVDAFSAPPGAAAAAVVSSLPNNEATSAVAAAGLEIAANSTATTTTAVGAFGAPPVGLVPGAASFPAMPVGNPIQGGSRESSGGAVDLFSKPSAGVSAATAFSSQAQMEQPKVEVGITAETTPVDAVAQPATEKLEQQPTLQQAPSRSWSVDSAESASALFSKGPPGGTSALNVFSATTPTLSVNPEPDAQTDEPLQTAAAAAELVVDVPATEPPVAAQEEEDPDLMDDIPLSPEAPKRNQKSSPPAAGALSANELFSAIGMPPPPFQKKVE